MCGMWDQAADTFQWMRQRPADKGMPSISILNIQADRTEPLT
jgi:hypothetical protein